MIELEQLEEIFYEESEENLELMENGLLEIAEGGHASGMIDTIFRAVHSIKGGSATFAFIEISEFSHVMETILDEMREGEREGTEDVINILLESTDLLKAMLGARQRHEDIDTAMVASLKQRLEAMITIGNRAEPSQEDASLCDSDSSDIAAASCWHILFSPHARLLQSGNDPALILNELAELGTLTIEMDASHLPPWEALVPEEIYLRWRIELRAADDASLIDYNDIVELFAWVEGECDLQITAADALDLQSAQAAQLDNPSAVEVDDSSSPTIAKKPTAASQPSGGKPQLAAASIRVDTVRIDAIMDQVGEIVITQAIISQLSEDFTEDSLEDLRKTMANLAQNIRELQASVMCIRMQPVSYIFKRFPRMVRDVSASLGKKIQLEVVGGETEIDKTMMEKLNDPLVHLVRNSIDHGLESPEQRVQAGKNEVGEVRLQAFHQGGNIVVQVSDDGAGLDRIKILDKACANGLVTLDEAANMPDDAVFELLFKPGFSTAEKLSDLSGRGVGLDVVRRNIEELDGSVGVESVLGQGSTFTIRLPLTLAVLDGMLFRLGNQTFVIPLTVMLESVQMDRAAINYMGSDLAVYHLRNEYIPIVNLPELLGFGDAREDFSGSLLIVVEWAGVRVGLLVDDLLTQNQIVVKSLETNFLRVQGLSGATILGDGRVALILDVPGIIALSKINMNRLNNINTLQEA